MTGPTVPWWKIRCLTCVVSDRRNFNDLLCYFDPRRSPIASSSTGNSRLWGALPERLAKTSLGTASTNPNIPVSQIDNSKAQRFEGVASQSVTLGTVGTFGWDTVEP
ncbi:MAG TPA: hypothetical protein VIH54_20815 [Chthoniobacterales bacterium]|jgi:hypothetical protein